MAVYNWTLGTDPNWVAPYRVSCPAIHVKTHDGYIRLAFRGALLDWLNPVQEAHFLRMGLVERIPADEQAAIADAPVEVDTDDYAPAPENSSVVDECLATLAQKGVPLTAGAPTCRAVLRDAGFRVGNATVAAAVKRRKSELSEATATGATKDEVSTAVDTYKSWTQVDDEENFEVVTF
jgi:hypothetical protein